MRAVYEWSARHLPFDMRHSIIEKWLNALIMVSGGSKQTKKPTGIHTHVRIAVTQYGACSGSLQLHDVYLHWTSDTTLQQLYSYKPWVGGRRVGPPTWVTVTHLAAYFQK